MAEHTTVPRVKTWLTLTDTADDALLADVVAATNAWVTGRPHIGETVAPDTTTGATMLAARLYRRRATPSGIDSIGADYGVVYVPRRDSDVDQLLGLGVWSSPAGQLG